ncbi:FAD dependent oxidoreductase [Hymenopellis radicata]|nr:FAD dependent oxidoreductase [Hymenopellis radicata]
MPLPASNPTKSFWIDSPRANPLAKEGSTGPLTTDADVCIIGSGMSGISAAYRLSEEPGLNVAIFEARDFCSGATGRNGGHLTPFVFQEFANLAAQYGVEQAKRGFALEHHTVRTIVEIIKEEGLEDLVDLVHGGHTTMYTSDNVAISRWMDYIEALNSGMNLEDVKWHSRAEMNASFGTYYPAVTFDAFNFWPLKFVTQLFKLAKNRFELTGGSLVLHTNTPVTDVLPTSDTWNLSTPRGYVSCRYVLHATNAYAGHLLPSMRGIDGIVPLRAQIIATKFKNIGMSSWANGLDEYWFPRPGGDKEHPLVILGGGAGERFIADDSVVSPVVGSELRKILPTLFGVEEREPEMEWTGISGHTKTKDPFVGPLTYLEENAEGQYITAGYSGHGMPRAFSCAQAVASMIIADMKNETWEPPKWLPDRYLTKNRA